MTHSYWNLKKSKMHEEISSVDYAGGAMET